jgi:ribosomal protein S18 acetylase RimI-like enzyme
MSFKTVALNSAHNKKDFLCGKAPLDNYLHVQVSQDIKRKLSVCFVHTDEKKNVVGYYTLSSDSIPVEILPEAIQKKMPQAYKNLPTTLLGRLAVDKNYRGKGIGELLLIDALKRAHEISNNQIASMAVIVDPLDEEAIGFYKKYGFIELPDSGKMFLPMKTIADLF